MPVALKAASGDAKRSSAPSVRHMPPPYAGPFTAAITGWGRWRISGMSRE